MTDLPPLAKQPENTGPFLARMSPLGWIVVLTGPSHVWWQNKDREEAELCARTLNAAWVLGYDAAHGKFPAEAQELKVTSTQMRTGVSLPSGGEA